MVIGVRPPNHVEFTHRDQGHVGYPTTSNNSETNRNSTYHQLQDSGQYEQHSQEPVPTQNHTGYSTHTVTFPAKNGNPKFYDSDTDKSALNNHRNFDSECHTNQHREPSQEALPTQIPTEHSKFPETSRHVESHNSRKVYLGVSKLIDQWQKKSATAEKSHDANSLANPSLSNKRDYKYQSKDLGRHRELSHELLPTQTDTPDPKRVGAAPIDTRSKQRKLPKVPDHRNYTYQSRDIRILQALPMQSLTGFPTFTLPSQEDTVAPVGVGLSAPVEIHSKKDLSFPFPGISSQEALPTHGPTGDSTLAPLAQSRTVGFAPPKNDPNYHFHTCDYYDSDTDELNLSYQYQSQDTEKESLPTQGHTGYTTLTAAQDEAVPSSSVGTSAPIDIYSKSSRMRDSDTNNPTLKDNRNSEYHTRQSRKPTQGALPTQSHTRYPGHPSHEEWYFDHNVDVGPPAGDDVREYGHSTGNHVEYVGPTTRERVGSPTNHQVECVPAPKSREIDESGTSNPDVNSTRSYKHHLQDTKQHLELPPQESLPKQSRTEYSDSSIPTFSAWGDKEDWSEGYIEGGRKGLGTPSLLKRLAQRISSYVQTPAIPLATDLRVQQASRVKSEANVQGTIEPSVTTSEDSPNAEGVQTTFPGQTVGFFSTAKNITIFGGSYQQNVYPTAMPDKNSQGIRAATPMQQPALIEVSNDLLGIGSCGTLVYRGSFQGRAVAVKKLLRNFVTLAEREVSILQQSDNHPNVIRYYHQETRENFLFIAIELCLGSLADIIEKPHIDQLRDIIIDFDPKKALEEITSGLDHLHHLNIVHRDIKPQNILISAPQRATPRNGKGRHRMLISDFGLCKKLDDDQTSFLPTTHGGSTVAGTRGWQGPEILRVKLRKGFIGEDLVAIDDTAGDAMRKLTKSMDIFPLGCLFYYTLTKGRHPYGGEFEREVNILKDTKDLRGLEILQDKGLKAKNLILQMLDPEPNNRPDTMICLDHSYFNS